MVAVGTGQAIKNARNGDGDVLFVHAKPDEEKFVADGEGVKRFDVMYNDFVIVGPKSDPAGVAGMTDVTAALQKIAAAEAPFASRGDDSGTHKAELKLWQAAGVDAKAASGTWYRETGSGMGPTLNTAAGMNAYALTDRGTWLSFQNRGDLDVLVEGDGKLFNQYGVILVNPDEAPERQGRPRPAVRRLADQPRGAEGDRRATRSTASSCSSPTPAGRRADVRRLLLCVRGRRPGRSWLATASSHRSLAHARPRPDRAALLGLAAPAAAERMVTDFGGPPGHGARPGRARLRRRAARLGAGLRPGAGEARRLVARRHPGRARLPAPPPTATCPSSAG